METDTDIITFEKTFNQRLEEYRSLLCTDKILPSSQMRSEWSYIAEVVLEPIGWKALWKIPANKRVELGIIGPALVNILVDAVDVKDLSAEVTVITGIDKNIPEQQNVFLVDLYPTVHQINDELYVKETADFIDKLRFFYNHLWMPWDVDDDDNQNWVQQHLESRLKLFFDMQNGSILAEMVLQLQYLISEGRRIQTKISELEDKIEDDMNDETVMCDLMDLHYCKDQIKSKFEMYEDPYKRSLLVWKQCRKNSDKTESSNHQKVTYMIWSGGPLNSYIAFLNEAKSYVKAEELVKSSFQLQESLDQAVHGDVLLLSEGCHGLLGLGCLEKGGAIRGVGLPESTILKPHNAGNILLDCSGGIITLENLTIDIQETQIAILVHNSTLHLRNCRIIGQKNRANSGLLVLHGGCVVAQDCFFSGLGAALVVYSKGETSLTACKIQNCLVGMKLQDDAKINLMKCEISECLEFGIKVEISRKASPGVSEVGSAGLLSGVGEIQLSDTSIKNNIRGDVSILQRNSIIHDSDVENPSFSFLLFNNPPMIEAIKSDGHTEK
ncbi:Protein nessun dorma [Gryllus bimaculatus]|nr:Protein nessun dorma [Gryllus bimaculatus]